MSKANYVWHEYQSKEALLVELADRIVEQLVAAIGKRGVGILALSGGSTPIPLFNALSGYDLAWDQIVITLVDERWVPADHELSNAALVQSHLLDRLSLEPVFVPLYDGADSVQESIDNVFGLYCEATRSCFESPATFDVAILGLGSDGHTASFFPDAENLAELIDPDVNRALLTCESVNSQVARVTWNLPMLLSANFLVLHITGMTKRTVFDQAVSNNDALTLPIRAAIFQSKTPLQVYYA
jgi:6-phosphogluconolactonase